MRPDTMSACREILIHNDRLKYPERAAASCERRALWVKDGALKTPGHGSLGGITRRTVLEVCDSLGLPAALATITRAELEDADEVFITSTAGGVMPITRVMGRIMGNDRPGPVYQRVHDTYWAWHRDPRFATPVMKLAA